MKSECEVGKTSYNTVRESLGTCCLPIMTLCQFQYGVVEISTLWSAVLLLCTFVL